MALCRPRERAQEAAACPKMRVGVAGVIKIPCARPAHGSLAIYRQLCYMHSREAVVGYIKPVIENSSSVAATICNG